MTKTRATWTSTEVLAFTENDGPGRPPAGPPAWMTGSLAGVLGVSFTGLLAADTLCPDHRTWVQSLGLVALMSIGAAVVSLLRGWAAAPILTVLAGVAGVGIGVLDAAHDPARGRLIALLFTGATLLALWLAARTRRAAAWTAELAPEDDLPEGLAPAVAEERAAPSEQSTRVRG